MLENKKRNKQLVALHKKGLGARRLGKMFGISPQRVSQVIAMYKKRI